MLVVLHAFFKVFFTSTMSNAMANFNLVTL